MILYDIDKLIIDTNQNGLYNLFEPTFQLIWGYPVTQYIVTRDTEMRIDLISNEIYGTTDYSDFLMDFNDIENPLNILEYDVILYVNYGIISNFRLNNTTNTDNRNKLLNINKLKKQDSNRKNYIDNNFSIPPTFKDIPQSSVNVVGNQIIIG